MRKVYYYDDNGEIIEEEYHMKNKNIPEFSKSPAPDKPTKAPKPKTDLDILSVHSIFPSISGEVGYIPQGTLVTILRLQECNLSCHYCDIEESQKKGSQYNDFTVDSLVKQIHKANLPLLITGGEPLLQSEMLSLLLNQIGTHITVQIETNGTFSPELGIRSRVGRLNGAYFVMDYKFDHPPNEHILQELGQRDYLKFVVSSLKEVIETFYLIGKLSHLRCKFAVSATDKKFYDPILEAVKRTNTKVLVNVQIHKFIGVQ